MVHWKYRKKEIQVLEDLSKEAYGFIYEIECENGKKYLGKKALYHRKKLKPLKGKKRKRIVMKESDWLKYYGSSKDLKSDVKNGLKITARTILKICKNKTDLSYYETKYLFTRNVLEKEEYYNGNILGRFFKRKNI